MAAFVLWDTPRTINTHLSGFVYLLYVEVFDYLSLSFVQDGEYGWISIFLHAGIQFDQHSLLDMLFFFSPVYDSDIFIRHLVSIGAYICVWFLNFILLINISVFLPVPCWFITIVL